MRARSCWRAEGLEAGYGTVQVLWGAGLAVRERETVVLLGTNGAGKTTLLKVLMGLVPAWKGGLTLEGRDIAALRTDARVRSGLVYMSEIGCFPGLTIDENIRIGGHFVARGELKRRMEALYDTFPALANRRSTLGGALSGGQRKMLGIAKALAGNPRLLVMDEPSSGLSPAPGQGGDRAPRPLPRTGPVAVDRRAERQLPHARRPRLHPRGRPHRLRGHRGRPPTPTALSAGPISA